MDNLEPEVQTTQDPTDTTVVPDAQGNWKQHLNEDLRNSPVVGKFADTYEGLQKGFESYANLEKLLGHEKVPIPKGDDDVEGWDRFSKAMGIPDSADAYGLADPQIPEEMAKELQFDKKQFAEMAHGLKLTPNQAKGLWDVFTSRAIQETQQEQNALREQMKNTVNTLRGKWGDTFDHNVHLGQMVINKFSGGNKELEAFLTTSLAKDPRGVEFLAKIGTQFAENKIGEFTATRFTQSPEQAMDEARKMEIDMDGAYHNQAGKFTEEEHNRAVDLHTRLIAIGMGQPIRR